MVKRKDNINDIREKDMMDDMANPISDDIDIEHSDIENAVFEDLTWAERLKNTIYDWWENDFFFGPIPAFKLIGLLFLATWLVIFLKW